jgi:hypothetical protein
MTEEDGRIAGQEDVDRWLHEAMTMASGGAPEPRLSNGFDARLMKRLRPRRLNATGRFVMAAYIVIAAAVTMSAMQRTSIDWRLALLTVAPALVAAVAYGRGVWLAPREEHLIPAAGGRRGRRLPAGRALIA